MEFGVGEEEQDGPGEVDVGIGEGDGLWEEEEDEGMELEECGGWRMAGEWLSEPVFLSESEHSDFLCRLEDGGGGRRGTGCAGSGSVNLTCVSVFEPSEDVAFDSRSRDSSCTTTSATSASFMVSDSC